MKTNYRASLDIVVDGIEGAGELSSRRVFGGGGMPLRVPALRGPRTHQISHSVF